MATVRDIPGDHVLILWDVDEATVDLEAHADFLMTRILASGNAEQVAWLRGHYGDNRIRRRLLAPGGVRGLSVRDVAFWSLVYGIPQEQADAWIDEKLASPWGR